MQSLARDAFEPLIVFVVVALLFYQVTILGRSPSEVVFLAFLFIQVARQILNAQSSYRKFLAARGSIEIFKKLEKELFENRETLNPDGREPDFGKELKFQDVTMVFPNGKEALKNVNLNIMPKSVVALVGFSGSGKSTIANMVSAILKPTSGMITLAGEDLSKLNLKTLRESIGYVTQEDIIFNATIKDNITLWESKVDDKKLQEVIEMSYISDFVSGLPNKEETFLGDNGLDISGGQRQRITVARELYKDTKLLILDEATSSLDSKSERHIYDSLRRFKGKKTMLVIAHRLSTVKNADYIYVFDEGKVVEKGSYDELIRREGAFKRMINEQRLTENDEEKVKI